MSFTPGPWSLGQPERWPFDLNITGPEGEDIISMPRIAHSSQMETLEDVMLGVGFDADEIPTVRAALAEQLANARLIAAAPELYARLVSAREAIASLDEDALGTNWQGDPEVATQSWPIRDEFLHYIDATLNRATSK